MTLTIDGSAETNATLTITGGVFDTAELVTNLTGMNTADITAMDGTSFTDFA
jgi:hypothetical protein